MIPDGEYGSGQPAPDGPVLLEASAATTRLPAGRAPGRARRGCRGLLFLAGAGACLVLGVAIVAVAGVAGLGSFIGHVGSATQTLDQYMKAMAAGDVPAALALFSKSATSPTNEDDLRELVNGANGALFQGYQELEVTDASVNWSGEGTQASIAAIVHYDGGYTGTLEAALRREGQSWRIGDVNVTVPPGKVQAFLKGE